jgi:decaprenyl-phosphate phosphoribosyltransferase
LCLIKALFMLVNNYIKLIRPIHWFKNLIIFLPLLLSNNFNLSAFKNLIIGFISFSLLASAGYIINDIRDVENDRKHFQKRNRPLASGALSVDKAFYLAIFLIIISFGLSFMINEKALLLALFYFVLNYFYSTTGKIIRFIDIILLSSFYVIRIFFGSITSDVELTGWFVATITLAVLSLSVNKRYMECINSNGKNISGRSYSFQDAPFLQIVMINLAMSSIILLNIHSYFVLSIKSPLFFVLLNLLAASISLFYFDQKENKSEDPVERILKNRPLLISLFLFVSIYIYETLLLTK